MAPLLIPQIPSTLFSPPFLLTIYAEKCVSLCVLWILIHSLYLPPFISLPLPYISIVNGIGAEEGGIL